MFERLNRLIRANQLLVGSGLTSRGSGHGVFKNNVWIGNNQVRDISPLAEDTAPDPVADFLQSYDTSAATPKKVSPRNAAVTVFNKLGNPSDLVINSNVETTIFSGTVKGNALGSHGAVRCALMTRFDNNSGVAQVSTLRIKLGGVTLFEDATAGIATSALTRTMRLEFTIGNRGDASSQELSGRLSISAALSPTVGLGDIAADPTLDALFGGSAGVDTTLDRLLEVTWQFTNANVSLALRRLHASMEYI
jgi:hypothetical protein